MSRLPTILVGLALVACTSGDALAQGVVVERDDPQGLLPPMYGRKNLVFRYKDETPGNYWQQKVVLTIDIPTGKATLQRYEHYLSYRPVTTERQLGLWERRAIGRALNHAHDELEAGPINLPNHPRSRRRWLFKIPTGLPNIFSHIYVDNPRYIRPMVQWSVNLWRRGDPHSTLVSGSEYFAGYPNIEHLVQVLKGTVVRIESSPAPVVTGLPMPMPNPVPVAPKPQPKPVAPTPEAPVAAPPAPKDATLRTKRRYRVVEGMKDRLPH